jgi:hypothetical protein
MHGRLGLVTFILGEVSGVWVACALRRTEVAAGVPRLGLELSRGTLGKMCMGAVVEGWAADPSSAAMPRVLGASWRRGVSRHDAAPDRGLEVRPARVLEPRLGAS